MAMKRYFSFSKAPKVKPQHQMEPTKLTFFHLYIYIYMYTCIYYKYDVYQKLKSNIFYNGCDIYKKLISNTNPVSDCCISGECYRYDTKSFDDEASVLELWRK